TADAGRLSIVVAGAHLSGMPLCGDLMAGGGRLATRTRTAPDYRFFALNAGSPARPGLVRTPGYRGPGIEVEVWTLPPAGFARFVASVPAPLAIGKVTLEDGRSLPGFIAEPAALDGAEDITHLG